jgi:phage terminase large subunit-like protein
MTSSLLSKKSKLEKVLQNFELFCLNFVKIVDNNGNLIPFELNDQQKDFINKAGRFNFILKPRQLGFTTLSLAYCLWLAVTNPNTNYLIVSYKGDSAKDLFEKIKNMNRHLPRNKYNIFPDVVRDNRDELVLSNGSRIVSTTTGTKDLGRGMTLMYILLSEAAFYDDLKQVLTSLEPSLAKSEKAKLVIETTANGFNYAQQLYDQAKKGRSKYKAFFLSVFLVGIRKTI